MKTPFTTEQFFSVFEQYNSGIFPFQLVIFLLGIFSLFIVITERTGKNYIIGTLLSFFWIWMGAVYHIIFFSSINPPAYLFGGLFILQGIFLITETYGRRKLKFTFLGNSTDYLALFFIVFGVIIYPVISYLLTSSLSKTISFGLPCPTTIATFGFFMLARKSLSGYLVIIPTLWALIGTTAALNFGVLQDFMLLITAIIANIIIFLNRKQKHIKSTSAA